MFGMRASAGLILLFFLSSPAAAFDTFWHAREIQIVGEQFGFSKDENPGRNGAFFREPESLVATFLPSTQWW